MRIAVVTGNPKPGSRTQGVALAVADALAAELDGSGSTAPPPNASPPNASPPNASPPNASLASARPARAPEAAGALGVPYVPIVPAVVGVAAPPTAISMPADPGPATSGVSGIGSLDSSRAPAHLVVDLAEHASSLFEPSAAELSRLSAEVAAADIAIFASPTYKAAYTGMLKAFLDRYGNNGLAGTVAVAVMTGGWAGHLLAVEVHLRPVLVELGATVPARGLYVTEPEFANLDAAIATWAKAAVPLISRALSPG